MTTLVELRQPLWMKTPKGEALAILLTDYGPESDHLWTCIQQEGEHQGELWTWHNSEVRVLPNSSMLRHGASPMRVTVDPQQAPIGFHSDPMAHTSSFSTVSETPADKFELFKKDEERSRTIGDVVKQMKDEAEWATSTQQPPMRTIKSLRRGEMLPQGYRQIETAQWGTILLRLDLPDSYPDRHPDEIPK